MARKSGIATVSAATVLELLKPVTWFPPMWAFACGVVSSGLPPGRNLWTLTLGVVLAGPLLCGSSQVVNDWFDRHVDAINEPHRPIPSGRVPGRMGLHLAVFWSALSLIVASALGSTVLVAAAIGLALAWAYSAPPVRLKQNGWWGNAACGIAYEGLAWVTGAAAMTGGQISVAVAVMAALYSVGAHGIMTLNDFKSIEGDKRTGIGSLPVRLGAGRAARVACIMMAIPQVLVSACLLAWDRPAHALAIAALVGLQCIFMRRLLEDPAANAPWYNATGVGAFVSGMMIAAFAIRSL